jgi:hypothetical protein
LWISLRPLADFFALFAIKELYRKGAKLTAKVAKEDREMAKGEDELQQKQCL